LNICSKLLKDYSGGVPKCRRAWGPRHYWSPGTGLGLFHKWNPGDHCGTWDSTIETKKRNQCTETFNTSNPQWNLRFHRRIRDYCCWRNKFGNTMWEIYRIDQTFLYCFLSASTSRDESRWIRSEKPLYAASLMRPDVKTGAFARPSNPRNPRVPIETKKTRNTIRSRVHQISSQFFSGPVCFKHVFSQRTRTPKCCLIHWLIPSTMSWDFLLRLPRFIWCGPFSGYSSVLMQNRYICFYRCVCFSTCSDQFDGCRWIRNEPK